MPTCLGADASSAWSACFLTLPLPLLVFLEPDSMSIKIIGIQYIIMNNRYCELRWCCPPFKEGETEWRRSRGQKRFCRTKNQGRVVELWAACHPNWSFCIFAMLRREKDCCCVLHRIDYLRPLSLLLLPAPPSPHLMDFLHWGVCRQQPPLCPHLPLFNDSLVSGLAGGTGAHLLSSRGPLCMWGRGWSLSQPLLLIPLG